jgi:NAD(P)-dependent dehydrogenase (short-subunit alcohol dehydrogenase family)
VNVVSPGWVETPMCEELSAWKTEMWRQMARRLPAGRIGTTGDIALAYVLLMESGFTTGTTLHIDGGHALI